MLKMIGVSAGAAASAAPMMHASPSQRQSQAALQGLPPLAPRARAYTTSGAVQAFEDAGHTVSVVDLSGEAGSGSGGPAARSAAVPKRKWPVSDEDVVMLD